MNWSEMTAGWDDMKAMVHAHWPKLTEDVLNDIDGDRAELGAPCNATTRLQPMTRKMRFASLKRTCGGQGPSSDPAKPISKLKRDLTVGPCHRQDRRKSASAPPGPLSRWITRAKSSNFRALSL